MKRSSATLLAFCLVIGAGAQPARAQTGAAGPQPQSLSLPQALQRASRQNLDLIAARLRRAVAQGGVRAAGQLPNPTINIAAARDTPHESLFFDQPLEIGGQRHHRIEFAQQQLALTDVEIDALTRQIRREVRTAYFAAAHAHTLTIQKTKAQELAKRVREIAQARFDAGDVPQLEVLQADLEAARADAEVEVSQQDEKRAMSELNVLLNEPAGAAWDLAAALEELPRDVTLAELTLQAQTSNPDLLHLAQEKKIEESHHGLLSAERVPTLGLQFGADFNAPNDFRVGPRGQLSLNLPIFSRNQGELAQSAASLQLLDSEAAATRRAVAGRVEAAYYDWVTRQTQVRLYRASLVPVAEKLETMARESYEAGRANILTVLDAQRNVQQVRREYLDSLLALQMAFADLEETVGTGLD